MRRWTAAITAAGAGCGAGDVAVEVVFDATAGDAPVACDTPWDLGGLDIELRDLRLYVSRVRALDGDGHEAPLALAADGAWQDGEVALLDFEDGSGACGWTGTPGTNQVIRGWLPSDRPRGGWSGVSFDLAVPVDSRHLDLAEAAAPLDVSGMFWGWTSGYKFLAASVDRVGVGPWAAEIGSTRCEALSDDRGDVACASANVATITLTGADPTTTGVTLDLGALFAGVDLADPALTACMSGPTEGEACAALFANLGLDFATGESLGRSGCSEQTAFRWSAGPGDRAR